MRGLGAQLFELIDVQVQMLNLFLQLSLALLEVLEFRFGRVFR